MTAVIGLLNKRGVAIAADSAVTRRINSNRKCTKNGNKMLRLSNIDPISVMLTGNACYCSTPWDIIIRHYREHQGQVRHETVEACVHDFFKYIAHNHLFCDKETLMEHLYLEMNNLFHSICDRLDKKLRQLDKNGNFIKAFLKYLGLFRKDYSRYGPGEHFKDYSLAQFKAYAGKEIDNFLHEHFYDKARKCFYNLPQESIEALKEDFELTLMTHLTRLKIDATLVFAGYGASQEYPSLVSATVFEGFDDRVNYHIRPDDIVCIGDDRPVAICPFAQSDVVNSILNGIYPDFHDYAIDQNNARLSVFCGAFDEVLFNEEYEDFTKMIDEIDISDLTQRYKNAINRHKRKNRAKWEKALANYDLQAMAALAHSLIDLTGFHRIIHFMEEGVGGPVDLAVITKNEGFTWLNRKSWYHHKDIGGKYGVLGV